MLCFANGRSKTPGRQALAGIPPKFFSTAKSRPMSACPKIHSPDSAALPHLRLYREYLAEVGDSTAAAILATAAAGPQRRPPKDQPSTLSPPRVALQLGVDPATVIGWIRAGELAASNVGKGGQRPRYRVQKRDLESFLKKRQPAQPPAKRQRRKAPDSGDVIEFFK